MAWVNINATWMDTKCDMDGHVITINNLRLNKGDPKGYYNNRRGPWPGGLTSKG